MELTPFFFGLYKLVKYGVYPLTWIAFFAGGTMVLAWLPPTPSRRRWIKATTMGICLLLFFMTTPLVAKPLASLLESWPNTSTLPPDARFQTIVVLGGGVRDRGTLRPTVELSEESRLRTLCGVDLLQSGYAPTLLVTGGVATISGTGPAEATAMKEWAIRLGVPPERIQTEERARTTYENAVETKRLLGDRASVLLFTSANHVARATALFEKQGVTVTPFACGYHAKDRLPEIWNEVSLFDLLPNDGALHSTTQVVEEFAGMVVYRLAGKL
jgi:uncharacterized SAM-binding protein YcdF (DUF218 family)